MLVLVALWVKWLMVGGAVYFSDALQQRLTRRADTIFHYLVPHVIDGKFVGMHQVFFIKTVIAQIIYHQLISRKIKEAVKFINKMMNCL